MDSHGQAITQIEPMVIRRECGGWLATTPIGETPRIGITAATEDEVRNRFRQAMARWAETLQESPAEAPGLSRAADLS